MDVSYNNYSNVCYLDNPSAPTTCNVTATVEFTNYTTLCRRTFASSCCYNNTDAMCPLIPCVPMKLSCPSCWPAQFFRVCMTSSNGCLLFSRVLLIVFHIEGRTKSWCERVSVLHAIFRFFSAPI